MKMNGQTKQLVLYHGHRIVENNFPRKLGHSFLWLLPADIILKLVANDMTCKRIYYHDHAIKIDTGNDQPKFKFDSFLRQLSTNRQRCLWTLGQSTSKG